MAGTTQISKDTDVYEKKPTIETYTYKKRPTKAMIIYEKRLTRETY